MSKGKRAGNGGTCKTCNGTKRVAAPTSHDGWAACPDCQKREQDAAAKGSGKTAAGAAPADAGT